MEIRSFDTYDKKIYYLHPELSPDTPIYKYMDFDFFLDMVKRKKFYVSIKREFEDRNEKRLPIKQVMPFRAVGGHLFKDKTFVEDEVNVYMDRSHDFDEIKEWPVSCWTLRSDENYLMWKSYTSKIGVRIQTTIDKFVDSITPNDYTIYCGKMTYCGYNPSQTIKELAFTKSHHFSNEEELRFYFEPQKNSCRKELSDSIFIELPMLLYVNCGNVIDEVILSPFIKDGAADMICDFLNRTEDLAKCSIKKSNIRLQ